MARNPAAVEAIARAVGLKTWPAFVERACCDKKEVFLNGGWRGGKSSSAAFLVFIDIILKWLATPGTHLIWLVGPDYAQARQEYFYLLDWLDRLQIQPVGDVSKAMQGPLHASFTRGQGVIEIATKQAGDPTSLGSVAPVIILACEAGQFSEEAMMWLYGRTAEKNATLIWSGTFENEEGKAQYAWFEEASEAAWTKPTPRQSAFRLPTWENLSLYDSCLTMIQDDPSLGLWCPEGTHGTSHSGVNHPMIRKLQDQWKDKPKDWRKRFGGEPVGVRNAVYEWLEHDRWDDLSNNRYLISLSEAERKLGRPYRWLRSAGGMDFGTVHPSALSVLSVNDLGQTWVRDCDKDYSGVLDWVWRRQAEFSKIYRISPQMWGRDPMVKYAPSYVPGEAMSGSLYAREARVGILNSLADSGNFFIDADNSRNVLLFREMQRVHRRRNANGQVVYVREEDDMTASTEDGAAMLHGQPILKVSGRQKLPTRHRQYALVTPRSAS
jgi:hypothetical protein